MGDSVAWEDETPSIDLVKATITVDDVAELLGLEVTNTGKITSPYNPDERTPSCQLYGADGFYDFSTGQGGDVIDFVRAYNPDWTVSQAIWRLWRKALKAGREPGDVERSPSKPVTDFRGDLPDPNLAECNAWAARLGVPIPTNCRTLDGNLLIPHEDQERVYGVKVREPGGGKSAWPGSQFTYKLYCMGGWDWIAAAADACIITEGESDCWAMASKVSCPVFALPSGAGAWKDHWLDDLTQFTTIWLCMDNDRAGKAALDKLTGKIGYLRAKPLRVPQLFGDAREAVAAGWQPAETMGVSY